MQEIAIWTVVNKLGEYVYAKETIYKQPGFKGNTSVKDGKVINASIEANK